MFGLAEQSNLGAVVSNPLHLCMRAVLLLVSVPGPQSGPTAHCRGEGTVASAVSRSGSGHFLSHSLNITVILFCAMERTFLRDALKKHVIFSDIVQIGLDPP